MINDIVGACGSFFTTLTIASELNSSNIWINLGISVASAVAWSLLSIGTKIITHYLEKKGIITSKQKNKIDDAADDLADDGRINDSNKK